MYLVKVLRKIILCLLKTIFLIAILFFIYYQYINLYPNSSTASNVNKKNILSLKVGMHENEIKQIMGEPLEYKLEVLSKSDDLYTGVSLPEDLYFYKNLIYGRNGTFDSGASIYVRVQNEKLTDVFIEVNDVGIYSCTDKECQKVFHKLYFDCYIPDEKGNTCALNKKLKILKDNITKI